jgi:integrase
MFPNSLGRPMNFDTLAFEIIKPSLAKAGIQWHGWHAFRRGLATNLYRLGVKDKIIQAILRHSNLSTTMNAYVKSVSLDATAAMRTLEAIYATSMQPAAELPPVVLQ